MLSPPRIGWKPLAQLSRRIGTGLSAGIDVRRVLQREAESGSPFQRRQLAQVRDAVQEGESLPDALARTGAYFPPFFREMIAVGEQTGKLDHVLPKLAEYYEHLVQLRRVFLLGIAWPALQLAMAVCVVGILILALGWVASMTGEEVDILGYGLVGTRGLVRYLVGLGLVAACGLLAHRVLTQGFLAHHVSQALIRIPGLGPNLRLTSLSRMAWALGLAIDSGAGARQSMRLALSSTSNEFYRQHADEVDRQLKAGREMHAALRDTGAFPIEFLDALEVGEQSGRVSETLLKLAEDYQQRAKATMTGVTLFATLAVWAFVAAILIFLIFRVFNFYLGILDEASKM